MKAFPCSALHDSFRNQYIWSRWALTWLLMGAVSSMLGCKMLLRPGEEIQG